MRKTLPPCQRRPIPRAALLALCGAAGALSFPAWAQQASLDRVEITGSAVKRVDAETALPVTVIKAEEMRKQGITSVEEIVRTLSMNQSYRGTSGAVGGITGGGSFSDLRALGPSKTLVLLNGRRIANQAVGGSGDSAAPDLNMIPMAAIDRIEVLRDGASSLYGSDAVAGVINFITRKDFSGAQASAQVESPQHSGGKSQNLNAGFGRGDLNSDGWNVFAFVDYQHENVLRTTDRSFSTSGKTSPTGFPGGWSQGALAYNPFAPACNQPFQKPGGTTCAYYYWNWVDLQPKTDRLSGMAKATVDIGGGHQFALEWFGTHGSVSTNIAPVPYGALSIKPGTPFYPGNGLTPLPTDAVGFDPKLPVRVRWRSVPAGPRQDESRTDQSRWLASLEGTVAGWDYAAGAALNRLTQSSKLTGGYTDGTMINDAVANGKLNPFAPVLDATNGLGVVDAAQVRGELWRAKGDVSSADLRVGRELGDWFGSGRKVGIGLGIEYRHEHYEQAANAAFAEKVISSSGFDPATLNAGSRDSWAAYGEMVLPVSKQLEVTASVRQDRFSDFGKTFNPKLALRFQPNDAFLVRGSLSSGFRAPSLYELHSAQVFTNTANSWNDPVRCPGGKPAAGATASDNCQVQFMALTGGNAKLQPEKSRSGSFGMVLQPMSNFDLTADLWWIELRNQISALSDNTVFSNPAKWTNKIVRSPGGTLATDGSQCKTAAAPGPDCGYVELLSDNLGGVNTHGIDLTATLRWQVADVGKFSLRLAETYVAKYEYQEEPGGPWIQNVGRYEGNAPIFRNQLNLTLNWTQGEWSAGLSNRYRSGYRDQDNGQAVVNEVGSYSTWDLYGSWAPSKNLSLTMGVKNLFDTKPPVSEQAATFQVGYDPRFANASLRSFYARANYRF